MFTKTPCTAAESMSILAAGGVVHINELYYKFFDDTLMCTTQLNAETLNDTSCWVEALSLPTRYPMTNVVETPWYEVHKPFRPTLCEVALSNSDTAILIVTMVCRDSENKPLFRAENGTRYYSARPLTKEEVQKYTFGEYKL